MTEPSNTEPSNTELARQLLIDADNRLRSGAWGPGLIARIRLAASRLSPPATLASVIAEAREAAVAPPAGTISERPDCRFEIGTVTNEDVQEFRRKLDEEDKHLTPEKARESLIRSGVLDEHGRPRWPVGSTR